MAPDPYPVIDICESEKFTAVPVELMRASAAMFALVMPLVTLAALATKTPFLYPEMTFDAVLLAWANPVLLEIIVSEPFEFRAACPPETLRLESIVPAENPPMIQPLTVSAVRKYTNILALFCVYFTPFTAGL